MITFDTLSHWDYSWKLSSVAHKGGIKIFHVIPFILIFILMDGYKSVKEIVSPGEYIR